jgi:TatD DNase family protein
MLIDTHSHLNFDVFNKDRDAVINRSLKDGVFMINVGSDYKTSKLAVEIAEKHQEGVYAAVALHPIHAKAISNLKFQISNLHFQSKNLKTETFNYEVFKRLAVSSSKVVAIGETGLDAMYPNSNQEEVFLEHLRLAKELNLPVILHCRKAHSDLISLLKTSHISCDRIKCVRCGFYRKQLYFSKVASYSVCIKKYFTLTY